MSALTRFLPLERRALMADALLFATAAGGSALGLLTLLAEEVDDSGWYEPLSMALVLAVVLLCPLAAWRLHGRGVERRTVPGVAVGLLLSVLVVWALVVVVGGLSILVARALGDTVSAGMVALLVTGVLCVSLVVWLVADALRDLARAHRHVGLDLGRLAATVVAATTGAGVAVWAVLNPGQDPTELLAFALAIGVVGAVAALGADVAATLAPVPKAPTS